MDQVFTVVSDVENYNKFVPWCKKSFVTSREPNRLKADLIIGFPPINESYTSDVTFMRPYIVKAVCTEGRLFNHLLTLWRFSPGLDSIPKSCVIDFQVAFEFRSQLHSQLANLFFDQVVLQMEGAFLKEVIRRYGRSVTPTQILNPNNNMAKTWHSQMICH